jgi:hypothetical protein
MAGVRRQFTLELQMKISIFKKITLSSHKKIQISWVLVAHICNPSYSGGRDQEDHCSKPAQVNSLRDPLSKKPSTKKGSAQVPVPPPQKKKIQLKQHYREFLPYFPNNLIFIKHLYCARHSAENFLNINSAFNPYKTSEK